MTDHRFALIVTDDGELQIEPGPAFTPDDIDDMVDTARAVKVLLDAA